MKRIMLTLVLAIAASVWNLNWASGSQISSLCDEWNILEVSNVLCGYCEVYRTYNSRLTTDTVIGGLLYSQLIEDGAYRGALREGTNRDIFYIPSGSTHEYLLYAFNAQKGDQLTNLWIGGSPADAPNGWTMTIDEIQETTPRTFVLSTDSIQTEEGIIHDPLYRIWIEGVGNADGPVGTRRPIHIADSRGYALLCAYKNGEQVYVSESGKRYGCDYNYDPHATHTDTIPLFIKDGPGSSTVEPVDPNLIYATLSKDILSIYAKKDLEINMVLYKAPSANHAPAVKRTIKATTFTDSISTTLTESGTYTLELTNPAWDYTVVGTFDYQLPQAVENTPANTPSATKILKDGRLFLRYKGQMYNVQGQQLQ